MSDEKEKSKLRITRPAIGFLAAAPYIIIHLVYFSLVNYGGSHDEITILIFFILIPSVFIGWVILLNFEIRKRRIFYSKLFRVPFFSICGLFFLIVSFQAEAWITPVVLRVPEWCRVMQKIEWSTIKPNEKRGGNHSYILMLVGDGNKVDHTFTSAYLNWTGNEPAGIATIRFDQLIISHQSGANFKPLQASLDTIRKRVLNSGLSRNRVEEISNEIWTVFHQVRGKETVTLADGKVDAVWTAPIGNEAIIFGGIIWMLTLFGVFQSIALLTLPINTIDHAE